MSSIRMPDLQRENYFSSSLGSLSRDERDELWHSESYREARETLSRQAVIPALSLLECIEELLAVGVSIDQVDVIPCGIQDAWEGEVVGYYPRAGAAVNAETRVRLFVSHPSLGDRLPDGFVASQRRSGERETATMEEWSPDVHQEHLEVARREETPAHRLLRVLESSVWRARLEMLRILGLFEGFGDDLPLAERLLVWMNRKPEGLDGERLHWLGNTLWILGRATGPRPEMRYLLESLLGMPVQIDYRRAEPYPIPEEMQTPLGEPSCRLGAGAILGEVVNDDTTEIDLQVGPLKPVEAMAQVRSPQNRHMHRKWAEALLPVGRPWALRYVAEDDGAGSRLGDSEPTSLLGVSARLPWKVPPPELRRGGLAASDRGPESLSTGTRR